MNIDRIVSEYARKQASNAEQQSLSGQLVPTVVERTGRGERAYDIFSRLLRDRIVFVGSVIDDIDANLVIAQLLFLQGENKNADINLYLNSYGGSVTAGLAIYDTMQFVQCDVATFCIGQAISMAAILLAAGAEGKRFVLPHCRIMLHQPWGGTRGTATDISIQAEEMVRLRGALNSILVRHTKKSLDRVEKDTERDFYMTAEDAREYGIVDEVIGNLSEAQTS